MRWLLEARIGRRGAMSGAMGLAAAVAASPVPLSIWSVRAAPGAFRASAVFTSEGDEIGIGDELPFNYTFFEQWVERVKESPELSVELGQVATSGRFVVVDIRMVNTGTDPRQNFDVHGLKLTDSIGEIHSMVAFLTSSQTKQIGGILDGYVDPGAENGVRLVFDVPADATGLRLVDGTDDRPGAWFVDIDRALADRVPPPGTVVVKPSGTVAMGETVETPAWDVAVTGVTTSDKIVDLEASRFDGYYVIVTLTVRNRLKIENAFPLNQLRLVLQNGDRHLPLSFDTAAYGKSRGEEYVGGASSGSPRLVSGPIAPGETNDVFAAFGSRLDVGEYWIEPAPSDDIDMRWSEVPWSIYLGEVTTST